MHPRRGRRFALASAGLAVLVTLAFLAFLKDVYLEHRAIRMLESAEDTERRRAAAWLAEKGGARAIRPLLEQLQATADPEAHPCFLPLERCLARAGRGATPALARFLEGSRGAVSIWAASAVWGAEPGNPDALAALNRALGEDARSVREDAFRFLEENGRDTVPGLIAALKGPDEKVRAWAASRLEEIGPAAETALPALNEALRDPDLAARLGAAQAIFEIAGPRVELLPVLIEGLQGSPKLSPKLCEGAAHAIARLGKEARSALPDLVLCLSLHEEPFWVLRALSAIGEEAVPALVPLLVDRSSKARANALRGLMLLGPKARAALPGLGEALEDPRVAALAADAIAAMGKEGEAAVPTMVWAIPRCRVEHRATILRALGAMGPAARDAVPALTEELRSRNRTTRLSAAEALGKLRAEPGSAAPVLRDLLLDAGADEWMRLDAARALAKLGGGPEALPALIRALRSRDTRLRSEACETLEELGPKAAPAAPDLRSLLADPSLRVFLAAAGALAAIDPERRPRLVPQVAACIEEPDRELLASVLHTLGQLGPAAAAARPKLVELALHDERGAIRSAAAKALGQVGLEDLAPFTAALAARDPRLREGAAFALQAMGPGARAAVPALAEALKDRDRAVRAQAATALGNFVNDEPRAAAALRTALRDRSRAVRRDAAAALEQVAAGAPARE